MTGSKPKTHQRSVDGTAYTVETSQHEQGISIVVTVPGIGPEEENDRTYPSEQAALAAGDDIARELIQQAGKTS
ncbi:MAG TPA: hypothetical protein VIM06_05665 [Rhodanobacter sp.]